MNALADRVAIVTGASTGIGAAIAEAFAAEGARVVLAARSHDKLAAVAARIAQSGGKAETQPTDVTREAEVLALFQRTLARFGHIDILVNNAGISAPGNIESLALEDWRRVLEVNLTGAFLCAREAFKAMKRQGGGRIINIGSVSARVPRPHSAPYTTSKFALEGLTRALALDGRRHGIAVSILHPGNTATPIWEGEAEQAAKEGLMAPDAVARIAVMMAALPPDMNLLEGLVLPLTMPFLGRG